MLKFFIFPSTLRFHRESIVSIMNAMLRILKTRKKLLTTSTYIHFQSNLSLENAIIAITTLICTRIIEIGDFFIPSNNILEDWLNYDEKIQPANKSNNWMHLCSHLNINLLLCYAYNMIIKSV